MPLHPELVRELSTFASTTDPLAPIMPMPEGTAWLREYFKHDPAYLAGDDWITPMPASPVSMIADCESVAFRDPDMMALPLEPGDDHYEELQELERYHRTPADGPAPSTLASTPNPLEPIMPLTEATQWLHEYFVHEPPYVAGDDRGTCFCSYAALVLSALVVGTESPVILAGVTSYPAPFVAGMLNSMRRANAWALENVVALKAQLKETPTDWAELQVALGDAMEMVWDAICTPGAETALESLRRRVLYGGETQNWLDEEALEFFKVA